MTHDIRLKNITMIITEFTRETLNYPLEMCWQFKGQECQ